MAVLLLTIAPASRLAVPTQLAIPTALLVAMIGWEVYGLREWRSVVRHRGIDGQIENHTEGPSGPGRPGE